MVGVRKFEDGDKALLEESVRLDPHHQGIKPEAFAAEPNTEIQVWTVDGKPVFFLRCSRALLVDIQFASGMGKEEVAEALKAAFAVVPEQARQAGFRCILYDSVYAPLTRFCERHAGFKPYLNVFRKWLGNSDCPLHWN